MSLRRGVLVGATVAIAAAAGCVLLACCCFWGVVEAGPCELWLLGPFTLLPLGVGLALIGRAAGRQPAASELCEAEGCGECAEA